jgi:hypothetical protein
MTCSFEKVVGNSSSLIAAGVDKGEEPCHRLSFCASGLTIDLHDSKARQACMRLRNLPSRSTG